MTGSAIPRPDVRPPMHKFAVDPCMAGWAVVDVDTGRSLAEKGRWVDADSFAAALNQAAAYGPKALIRALGASED